MRERGRRRCAPPGPGRCRRARRARSALAPLRCTIAGSGGARSGCRQRPAGRAAGTRTCSPSASSAARLTAAEVGAAAAHRRRAARHRARGCPRAGGRRRGGAPHRRRGRRPARCTGLAGRRAAAAGAHGDDRSELRRGRRGPRQERARRARAQPRRASSRRSTRRRSNCIAERCARRACHRSTPVCAGACRALAHDEVDELARHDDHA